MSKLEETSDGAGPYPEVDPDPLLWEAAAKFPKRGPFHADVLVWSNSVALAEITKFIGVAPDESHDIGDRNPFRRAATYRWARWVWYVNLEDGVNPGSYALTEAVESLSDDFADRLAGAAAMGCQVVLAVVQKFDDEDSVEVGCDSGFYLSPAALAWLARAGAELSIDQYP